MGIARAAVAALVIALVPGCATSAASSTLEQADRALREGEYERAFHLYEVELTERPGDRLLQEKLELARKRAATERLDSARRAEREGDLDQAIVHAERAAHYDPDDPDVAGEARRLEEVRAGVERTVREADESLEAGDGAKAIGLLEGVARYRKTFPEIDALTERARTSASRATARRLAAEGAELDSAGDALAAFGKYRDALALDPDLPGAAAGREAARRAAALRIASQANAEADGGRVGAALALLAEGKRSLGGDDPDLAASESALRFQAREHLRTRAEADEKADRPAAALLLLRAAAAVDPSFDRELVAAAEERLAAKLVRKVRLERFEDGTGGRVDAERFTERVRERLVAEPPGEWLLVTTEAGDAALVVSGEVTSVEVEEAEPVVERKDHEHLIRVEQEPNPARPRLQAELGDLESRLGDAEEQWEAARDERDSLERLEGSASVRVLQGSRGRFVGPYSEATYYRILGNARSRESRARRNRDRLRDQADQVRRQLERTPYYLEQEVYGRAQYDAVTRVKNAVATAEIRVGPEGSATRHEAASASMEVRDTFVKGNDAIGLPEDPDEMPSDVEVAWQVLDRLAARVAEQVGAQAVELRRSLLTEAREREKAGDEEGALDRYAAFALTAGEGMELERANACGHILRRWGIDLTGGAMDIGDLRY